MGNISEFIKATGNCKIMVEKIRTYLKETNRNHKWWLLSQIDECEAIKKDENGEEFITLQDFGEMINDSKFYGYFDDRLISGLHVIYEAMSINGMQCYESKTKPKPTERRFFSVEDIFLSLFSNTFALGRKEKVYTKIDGYHQKSKDFKNYDELHEYFKKYLENVPVLKISKGFYDISIKTREQDDVNSQNIDETVADYTESLEESSREEPCRKKQKTLKNDESCKCYFVEAHQTYLYVEFLPYGEGIKLAVASNYPFIDYSDDYDEDDHVDPYDREKMNVFFAKVKDTAFCWEVQNI